MVSHRMLNLRLRLEIRRVDPLEHYQLSMIFPLTPTIQTRTAHVQNELSLAPHRGMLQCLDDTHIRVFERGVLADENDGDGVEEAVASGVSAH